MLKIYSEEINTIIPQNLGIKVLRRILQQTWDMAYDLAIESRGKKYYRRTRDLNRASRYVLVRSPLTACTKLWELLKAEFPEDFNLRGFDFAVAELLEKYLPDRKELFVRTENCRMPHTYNTVRAALNFQKLTVGDIIRSAQIKVKVFRRKHQGVA